MCQTQFWCTRAGSRDKSVWANIATISHDNLEGLILNAPQNNRMDEKAFVVFCDEYSMERTRLQAEAGGNRCVLKKVLVAAKSADAQLIGTIIAGIPADQVKDRRLALNAKRIELATKLSKEPALSPIRIHLKMAEAYRAKSTKLYHK